MIEVVLTPYEGRRLIARAVVNLPEMKKALAGGIVCVARGMTNGMILEEIVGDFDGTRYISGCILPQRLCQSYHKDTFGEIYFLRGELKYAPSKEIIKEMGAGDVFIKGANAIDVFGNAGILVGNEEAGTIGGVAGAIYAKGIEFLIPVGLEKMVMGSICDLSRICGTRKTTYSTGMPVGIFPVTGKIITEIEAIESFADVTVSHMASGGVCGAEGSVVLAIDGKEEEVKKAQEKLKTILGEEPISVRRHRCKDCLWKCPWAGKEKSY